MNKTFKNKLLETKPKKVCRYCRSTENLTYDHKHPLTKGGKDTKENIQVLCFTCNGMKSDLSHKQLLRLFRWFTDINLKRKEAGKKPMGKPTRKRACGKLTNLLER